MKDLQVILINYFGSAATSDAIADWVNQQVNPQLPVIKSLTSEERMIRATGAAQERPLSRNVSTSDQIPIVLRLAQGNVEPLPAQNYPLPIYEFRDLEPAIAQTLACLERGQTT
jgi:succinyl-CoA synthetase beta subunit